MRESFFADAVPGVVKYAAAATGALLVVLVGKWLASRQLATREPVEIPLDAGPSSGHKP